jgi:sialate O-acetylesterase
MRRFAVSFYAAWLHATLLCLPAFAQSTAVEDAPAADAVEPADDAPKLALASMFSDHMVLQRDMNVPVWGVAEPGAEVAVTFDGTTAKTTADDEGNWRLELDTHGAGGPFELAVSAGGDKLTVSDVLMGDVWIASGQSNMEWPVAASSDAEQETAAAADFPQIRFIDVPKVPADEPRAAFENATWMVCSPETIGRFSAVAYSFGRELNRELDVPIGLIGCNWGGTPMEAWTSRKALESSPTFAKALADDAAELEDEEQAKRREQFAHHRPARLFNGMLSTVVPYGIRGAIWYQGESNAGRHQEYAELSKLMIADWRARWDQGDFPFLLVQLAAWEPGGDSWPYLREAQVDTLDAANVGMATAIDIGDKADIHPRNKREVGRRLALAARAIAHGENLCYSGPTFREALFSDGRAMLSFDHLGGGLEAKGDKLEGFEIAGEDGKFVPAAAAIDGDTIVVSSESVGEPTQVRYAWAAFPNGNLFNKDGLPAVPFRSKR